MFNGGDKDLSTGLFVDNPIRPDLDYMRPSALSNLALYAQQNIDHGAEDIRLFEVGPSYLGDGPKDQRITVTALIPTKARSPLGWYCQPPYDTFDAKADLFALLESLSQTR